MDISIVVPAYNEERRLTPTLQGWAERVFRTATVDGFAFDIEILYLAKRMGARIVEMPVEVEFRDESTFDVSTHLRPFLSDIWQVRKNAWRGRYA